MKDVKWRTQMNAIYPNPHQYHPAQRRENSGVPLIPSSHIPDPFYLLPISLSPSIVDGIHTCKER